MKTTVYHHQFIDAFMSIRPNNFSYAGLNALFDYFEQYETDCGCEIELDVIAICCDFTEFENIEEFNKQYGEEFESMDYIENFTTVIPVDDESFIIQNY